MGIVRDDQMPLGWPIGGKAERRKEVFASARASSASQHFLDHRSAIGYSGSAHLLSIARTGAGKGVSTIIPALLSYPGPTIVIDPKGENFLVTSRWRRETLGHTVYAIDPFHELDKHPELQYVDRFHGLNIFEPILTKTAIDKADSVSLSRIISGVDPLSSYNPFWDNSAQDLLAGIIQHVLTSSDIQRSERTLSTVISIAAQSDLKQFLNEALLFGNLDANTSRSFQTFLVNEETVAASIRSYVNSYLSVFDSAGVKDALSSGGINLEQIKRGENFTIYIVMPPGKLMSHARVLRLIVGSLLQ